MRDFLRKHIRSNGSHTLMVVMTLFACLYGLASASGQQPVAPVAEESARPTWEESATESTWKRVQELLSRSTTAWPDAQSAETGEQTPAQPQAVSVARALSLSGDVRQRLRAIELWSVSASHESTAGLLAAFQDPDERVRRAAARALSSLDSLNLINRVFEVLANPASEEARAIMGILPELRPQLEARMTDVLDREDAPQQQRWIATYCLGRMGCVRAAPLLMRFTQSEDAVLARTAAEALASLRSPETAKDWFQLAQHPDSEVRRMAIEAIGVTGGYEGIDFLRRTAYGETEQDLFLQTVAVQQIAGLSRETSVPMLIDLMKNHLQMRGEATHWLRSITGMDLPENPVEWEQWYKLVTGQVRPPLVAADEEPPPPLSDEYKAFPKVPPEWSGQGSPIEMGQWE